MLTVFFGTSASHSEPESPTASLLLTTKVISLKRRLIAWLKYKCKIDDSENLADINFFFSAEDEAAAARSIAAKNGLRIESYLYNLRKLDEKIADKFDVAGKSKLETAVNETINSKWFDASQEGLEEDYKEKQRPSQT